MKRKLVIGLIFIFAAILFAWHFIAANQAEKQIDAALQEQFSKPGSRYSINYNPIQIAPFYGDIEIQNLSITGNSAFYSCSALLIDLQYGDFLNFYARGTETGLRNIDTVTLDCRGVSYLDRVTLDEYKADSLRIDYRGDAWELLRHVFEGSPVASEQTVQLAGKRVTVNRPETNIGTFLIQQLEANASIPGGSGPLWTRGRYEAAFDSIRWTPPPSFREKYRFFIQGFGFESEAIPLSSSVFEIVPSGGPGNALTVDNTQIITGLATLSADGRLIPDSTFAATAIDSMRIRLTNFSVSFRTAVENFERLMNRRITAGEDEIHLIMTGTLRNPKVSLQ